MECKLGACRDVWGSRGFSCWLLVGKEEIEKNMQSACSLGVHRGFRV